MSFPVAVDTDALTSTAMEFRVVPNGILVDEEGVVRYANFGDFEVDDTQTLAAVERFALGEDAGPSPRHEEAAYGLGRAERELVQTKLRFGGLLASLGRREEAVAEWRSALRLDPQNLVIRKQIWALLYPERFHPRVDWDWQREQLAGERQQEIAEGFCGPDGCPLPEA